jgi:hypothetical protein
MDLYFQYLFTENIIIDLNIHNIRSHLINISFN